MYFYQNEILKADRGLLVTHPPSTTHPSTKTAPGDVGLGPCLYEVFFTMFVVYTYSGITRPKLPKLLSYAGWA